MDKLIAVFGATGYVGSRLIPKLLDRGYQVRATYRNLKKIKKRYWMDHPNLELSYCDIFEYATISKSLKGVSHAYYLIHSLKSGEDDYPDLEKKATKNMIQAAKANNVKQIVYLGGLGDKDSELSKHLKSRIEVGEMFHQSPVNSTVLRASIILGSGSASFEILRHLVEKLPVMITPRWVRTRTQPIAIRNVINYLVGCLDNEKAMNQMFDIGGEEILTFEMMMQIYAEVADLTKRLIIPAPILTPKMSSRWVKFITPLDEGLATELVEGLRNETVCKDNRIHNIVSQPLLSIREAIRRAISERDSIIVYEDLDDSLKPMEWHLMGDSDWSDTFVLYDRRTITVRGDPDQVWREIVTIGGKKGWYYANFLWSIRGIVDEILGGPGMRRGRRHPTELKRGDIIDCWRVEKIVEGKQLILKAEMKLPGNASLKFALHPLSDDTIIIEQNAVFIPQGLLGMVYWKFVEPLHMAVFEGLLKAIARRSGVEMLTDPLLVNRDRILGTAIRGQETSTILS